MSPVICRFATSFEKRGGGRGRSRTHQAHSMHLTGFEDQAPHRGHRSSEAFAKQ